MKQLFFALTLAILSQPALSQSAEPGIVTADQTGLPSTLWLDETTSKMSRLMGNTETASLNLINRLWMTLDISSSSPALETQNSEEFGAARLEYLWRNGALDAAEELGALYDWESALIRNEIESIALLSTRPEKYCTQLLNNVLDEIQNGMRVYCLARDNQWEAAEDEFHNIEARLAPDRKALLMRFLDLDGGADPLRDEPWIDLPPPFDFVLDESIGRPRGLRQLPPAYAYFSRESGVTPRTDLEISEELVHLGALPLSVLFASYRANVSAESGGAWGRAEVIQWLDALDENSSEEEIFKVISTGEDRFRSKNMEQIFAIGSKQTMSLYDPTTFESPTLQQAYIRLSVLGGWSQKEWGELIDRSNPDLMLAFKINHPELPINANQIFSTSEISRILKPAFFGNKIAPLEANSFGEAIWQSLYVIDGYQRHPEFQVTGAFQSLLISGLDTEARLIAVSMLLSSPE